MSPRAVDVHEHEDVRRAVANVFVVGAGTLPRFGTDGNPFFADELARRLVEAHHRSTLVGRLGVDREDVLHAGHELRVDLQRTSIDFAECMRDLVDEHYPEAERIRVVLDNLSTHSPAALYERFAPAEARRILSRIEFHFTPKHASWLNMVEIEIGVMVGQCLNRRIPDKATLVSEIAHWERRRNRERASIDWMFTVERAREKLGRAYPAHKGHPARRLQAAA